MTKTVACWDRTEGCCMVDAFEAGTKQKPKREWGNAPATLFKMPAGCWHWTCTICSPFTQHTGCGIELAEAVTGLADHQHERHAL